MFLDSELKGTKVVNTFSTVQLFVWTQAFHRETLPCLSRQEAHDLYRDTLPAKFVLIGLSDARDYLNVELADNSLP